MTITIRETYDNNFNIRVVNYVTLTSKNSEFIKDYGKAYKVYKGYLFETLQSLTRWANNDLGEECLFEIE